MNFNTKGFKWWRWLWLFAIWLIVPGGSLIVLAWLFMQEVHLEKELSAYYDASFGEFLERKRKEKEEKLDIHPISNE